VRINTHENRARVVHHLDGAYTMVEITDDEGARLNMPNFHMPTDVIPVRLRRIGSRFVLRWRTVWPEDGDSVDDLRAEHARAYEVIEAPLEA
jgi:hypothetical protein